LRNRGAEALAAVDLAVIGGDLAVFVDRNVGIEPVGRQRAGSSCAKASGRKSAPASPTTSAPVEEMKARRLSACVMAASL